MIDGSPDAKMRVLVLSQYFWPESFRINDVVAGLVERGHDVVVLTGMPNYPVGRLSPGYSWSGPWAESWSGARIVRSPLILRGRANGLRLAANYLSFAAAAAFVGTFRTGSADVMLVFEPSPITVGLPAAWLRLIRGIPIVFWAQDLWPESLVATGAVRSRTLLRVAGALTRFIYRRCDEILVQSRAFIPSIEALGVPHGKLEYLPNSAESFYQPVPRDVCRAEDAELPPGFRVTFAGNLGAAQDLATVLGAAELTRDVRDLQWLLIGDGRMRPTLEREIAARGLGSTVHLIGSRPAHAMPRYFAVSDALLVTLRRDPIFASTIPSKLQSYLACGKPVIAGLDGEGSEIVGEAGAGVAVPSESPALLSAAVRRVYGMSAAERRRMGDSGRRYFEANFERESLLDRLERILQRHVAGVRQ